MSIIRRGGLACRDQEIIKIRCILQGPVDVVAQSVVPLCDYCRSLSPEVTVSGYPGAAHLSVEALLAEAGYTNQDKPCPTCGAYYAEVDSYT